MGNERTLAVPSTTPRTLIVPSSDEAERNGRVWIVPAPEPSKDSMAAYWLGGGEITLGYPWAADWLERFRASLKQS
jgi:hypothetical protein